VARTYDRTTPKDLERIRKGEYNNKERQRVLLCTDIFLWLYLEFQSLYFFVIHLLASFWLFPAYRGWLLDKRLFLIVFSRVFDYFMIKERVEFLRFQKLIDMIKGED